MARPFPLESFDNATPAAELPAEPALPEEKWLEAFEKGYQDGWEDAAQALEKQQDVIASELAQRLQDLDFTIAEARHAIQKETAILLQGVFDTLLPATLPHFLGPQLLSELETLTVGVADATLEITVNAEQTKLVEAALAQTHLNAVRVIGRPDIAANTALMQLAGVERRIDLQAALSEIAETVMAYFDAPSTERERAHV